MKSRLLMLTTFVLFSSLFTISEVDALIVGRSLEDLAEKAEFVVIGKVIEISPNVPWYLLFVTDGYDKFLFDVTLSVEDDLDGKYGQDTILFSIHDSREEFGMDIEDEQNFEVGERVLVFIGEKELDSVMGDAYLVYGVTQGKYLLQDKIAYGTDFPEGIDEEELILKIKNIRGVDENVELDCFLTEYWNGVKCVPYDDEPLANPQRDIELGNSVREQPLVPGPVDETQLCGGGAVIVDGVCQVIITHNVSIFSNKGFITFLIILVVLISVSIGLVIYWRKRK